jgi:hypothetical protein
MLVLTIVTALAGFALGAYATYRYAPSLGNASSSIVVGLIVCGLVGAACGLACMYVYLAVHSFTATPPLQGAFAGTGIGSGGRSPDSDIFTNAVYSIASECGPLLAIAAGVYLLAPSSSSPETAS